MGLTVVPGAAARRRWLDAGLTVGAVAIDLTLFTSLSDATDQTGWAGRPAPWLVLAGGLVALPLLWWRRRAPVAACLAIAGHGALVTALLGSRPLVAPLVALYAAAARGRRTPAVGALTAVLAAHGVAVGYEASFTGPGPTVAAVGAVTAVYLLLDLASWSVGRFGAGAAARARERRLEESRAEQARLAVEEERRRIARELHDIVAHAVTVMVLQSAGAKRLVTREPQRAADAMGAVEAQGRQAVAELRRLLGVLQVADAEPVVPHPWTGGVGDRVRDTVTRMRATGLGVVLETAGEEVPVDASVAVTVERVVREGLVNVARHAGVDASGTVRVTWTPEQVVVEVLNPVGGGPGPAAGLSSGHGLAGLSERVRLIGGRLAAEDRGDGFRLVAELPTTAGHEQELVVR